MTLLSINCIDRQHVNAGGYGGCYTPPIIYPVGKPESSRKFKALKKLDQSEFKIGTNYTIQVDNWKLFSKQKSLRDNLQGYVTLKFRPSERVIIDLINRKFEPFTPQKY